MNPLEFIRAHAPFNLLPSETLGQVERGLEITFFPKDSKVLERNGPKSQHLYMIRKGTARLER
ncbi:MAG: cyclic nucleotide-binding protein, partial [Meiothermus ruber]